MNLERPDDVPFEEQLRGLEAVIKAGKVPGLCLLPKPRSMAGTAAQHMSCRLQSYGAP